MTENPQPQEPQPPHAEQPPGQQGQPQQGQPGQGEAPPPGYDAGYQAGYQVAHQPPPRPTSYRRLTRARGVEAPIAGVCGGLARYLNLDPTLVRILVAIAMVVAFPMAPIAYVVMWAVVPQE